VVVTVDASAVAAGRHYHSQSVGEVTETKSAYISCGHYIPAGIGGGAVAVHYGIPVVVAVSGAPAG